MERMCEIVPDTDHQALHHFISNAKWNEQNVFSHISREVYTDLKTEGEEVGALVDESSFSKKGKSSAGVARQYLGSLGKIDNGQVGVFTALSSGNKSSLTLGDLYLPKDWVNNEERCNKVKIPEEKQFFQTKDEIAFQQLKRLKDEGIEFDYASLDAGYGKGFDLMYRLEAEGIIFSIDIHRDTRLYFYDPSPFLPEYTGSGRMPTIYKTKQKSIQVDQLVKDTDTWRNITVRKNLHEEKISYNYIFKKAWIFDDKSGEVKSWTLIIRKDDATGEIKYSLTNAPSSTSQKKLAIRQAQRYFVERCFEDAKSTCGMSDYQIRSWTGWHRHMALVMLAQLFILKEKEVNREKLPLLSSRDIEILLAKFLPKTSQKFEDIFEQIQKRHTQRSNVANSRKKKSRKRTKKCVT